jgi:hypothetical protein
MVTIGNHMKMTLRSELRPRIRAFYGTTLGLKSLTSPRDDLDLYEFAGGFVLGIFFTADAADVLPETEHLKSTWLELKVEDPVAWKRRLQEFGVREVDYPDGSNRFYFQAPGGQVFRLAGLDGSL